LQDTDGNYLEIAYSGTGGFIAQKLEIPESKNGRGEGGSAAALLPRCTRPKGGMSWPLTALAWLVFFI